jgi:iron complex outermembrane receptor protein
MAGKKGLFDYSLSGSFERIGGLYDARGDRIPPDLLSAQGGLADLQTYNLFGKVGVDLGAQRLQLSLNRYDAQQDTDYVTDFNNVTAGKAVAMPGLVLDKQSATRNTVINLDYSRPDLLGSKVYAQAYYRDYLTRFFPFDGRTNATVGNNIIQSRVLSEKWGGRLTVETPIPVVTQFRPTLIWGADATQERTSQRVALMDPTTFSTTGGLAFRPIDDRIWVPQMTQRNLGIYGQLEVKLHERWLVRGGVRHERIALEVDDPFVTLRGRPIASGSRDFDATVFNAGTVVYLTDAVNVFANYSQGFSIPDVGLIIRDAPAGFSFSDSQLAPIKVNHYELGVRADWRNVQTSLTGYYNESLLGVTSAGLFANLVRAPERVYGVEGTIDVQADRWAVGGTATYVEGENDINRTGDYKYLNGFRIPPLKVTAYVEHLSVPAWNWRNRVQVLYSGTRDPGLGEAVFGGRPVHSFTIVDLISTVKAGPGVLRFGIENLLNSQYYLPISQLQRVGISSLTAARGMVVSLGYSFTW